MDIYLIERLATASAALECARENGHFDLDTDVGSVQYDRSIQAQKIIEDMILVATGRDL